MPLLAMTSCANHDLIPDMAEVGQAVPTCYWEVGSTACKAGESFSFQGKYSVEPDKTPDRSEIWYRIVRDESAAATVKLAGASLSYTKTYTSTDTMRTTQTIEVFPHSQAEWDGYEFVINGTVNVSRTLSPISWVDAAEWDQDKFDTYYPAGFADEFKTEVINLLTQDSTYYTALRNVYINYPFTNEQFAAVNAKHNVALPADIDMSGDDQGSTDKSDLWFVTTEASDDAVVGYYYKTIGQDGNAVVHEVPVDYVAQDGVTLYPVYKSSAWVFCRYDDDQGAIISTVRAQYIPAFRELLTMISFDSWIYDSSETAYKVEFSRKYTLNAQFRVYDTDGNEGIASDVRDISIN